MTTLDVQKLIDDCAQDGGGTVALPPGVYDCDPFTIPDKVSVTGASTGDGSRIATTLVFPADTPVCVHLAGGGASLQNVAIRGPSQSTRAVTGVLVSGHASLCRGVQAHYMTDYGFLVAATGGAGTNANGFALERCRASRCAKAGFYVNGAETNAGIIYRCDADANEGYGFFDSSFLGNAYIACHASPDHTNPEHPPNYAQGGTIETPSVGGTAIYSTYTACYAEGSSDNPFSSAQTVIVGGNLGITACGWPDANGAPTGFPGQVIGHATKLTLRAGAVSMTVPNAALDALGFALFDGMPKSWTLLRRWNSVSPAWLKDTFALLQYDKSGWQVPYAATGPDHAAGPGRRVYGAPLVSSPFRFVVALGVSLQPSPDWQAVELSAPLLAHDLPGPASTHVVRASFRETDPLVPGVVEIGSHFVDVATKKIRVRVRAVDGASGDVVCDVERVAL